MRLTLTILALAAGLSGADAELRGHGGPVRAIDVSADGGTVISGSFDTTAIVWNGEDGTAEKVLRLHEDSVNAVTLLPDGRMVTAGQDGRIALWGKDGEARVIGRHEAPVAAIAVSPEGDAVASASWDGTARITPLDGGEPRIFEGHEGNVNAVAFLPDGRLVTAGYDMTLRIWPQAIPDEVEAGSPSGNATEQEARAPKTLSLGVPLNALAVAEDGTIVAAGGDGLVRLFDAEGEPLGEVKTVAAPVTALALSPDGKTIASATVEGSVWLIDRAERQVRLTLQGADNPVWSLAFDPESGTLLAGGGDRVIREWDPATGEQLDEQPIEAAADYGDSRGAEVFAACSACHTLSEDGGNRAGPTLHGIFGRPIASVPDYDYSEAFEEMDIVWTPETVAELFTVGPDHYTPGTKMPEQRIANPEDRAALIEFLKEKTE
jgi:cytochrome c